MLAFSASAFSSFSVGFGCTGATLEQRSILRRRCRSTGGQLGVIHGEFTHGRFRLGVEIRQLLAVRAHAGAQISARIADEALGHRHVALRLGRVPIGERGEVCAELRLVARLGSRDELTDLQSFRSPGAVSCAAPFAANVKTATAASASERKWTVLMTDQPLW